MRIILLSPDSQPFGLLSNNAQLEITGKRGSFSSLTEFVYCNLVEKPDMERMKRLCAVDPFPSALKLVSERAEQIYLDALRKGMMARFSQSARFKDALKKTQGQIVVRLGNVNEDRTMTILLTELRAGPSDFFHSSSGKVVSKTEVSQVIGGVKNQLLKNPDFPNATFSELLRYADKNAPPFADIIAKLENLDEIVQVVKIAFKKEIFSERIHNFKKHLLNVTLDHFLKKDYPEVPSEKYWTAKSQQIAKEKHVSFFEDKLFEMYSEKALPSEIVDALSWTINIPESDKITGESVKTLSGPEPQIEVRQFAVTKKPIEQRVQGFAPRAITQTAMTEEQARRFETLVPVETSAMKLLDLEHEQLPQSRVIVDGTHFLSPYFNDPIEMKGKKYDSVLKYSYFVLLDNVGKSDLDVNASDPGYLQRAFHDQIGSKVIKGLTDLVKLGIQKKFEKYEVLKSLLLATGQHELIWGDCTDIVLGSGRRNIAGQELMLFREALKSQVRPTTIVNSMTDNIIFSVWLRSRAEDYANTLKLFLNKNATDLTSVYGIDPVRGVQPSELEKFLMNKGGLSDEMQRLIFGLIVAEFTLLKNFGIDITSIVKTMVDVYLAGSSKLDAKNAESFLKKIYEKVRRNLYPSITEEYFVDAILSNQQQADVNQRQAWRVNRWAKLNLFRGQL